MNDEEVLQEESSTEPRTPTKRSKAIDRMRDESVRDLQVVMSTPNGRRFVNRLRMVCNPTDCTFVSGELAAYRDGVQSVAAWIDKELTSAVELQESYLKMIIEAMTSQKENHNG